MEKRKKRFLGQIEPKLQKLDLKIVFIDGKSYPDLEEPRKPTFAQRNQGGRGETETVNAERALTRPPRQIN